MDNKAAITSAQVTHPLISKKSDLSWCAPLLTLIVGIGLILGGYFWGEAINSFSDAGPLSLFALAGVACLIIAVLCTRKREPEIVQTDLAQEIQDFAKRCKYTDFLMTMDEPTKGKNKTCIFEDVHIVFYKDAHKHQNCALMIGLVPFDTPRNQMLHPMKGYFISEDREGCDMLLECARAELFNLMQMARDEGQKIVIACPDGKRAAILLTEYLHQETGMPRHICYHFIRSKRPEVVLHGPLLLAYMNKE